MIFIYLRNNAITKFYMSLKSFTEQPKAGALPSISLVQNFPLYSPHGYFQSVASYIMECNR